MRLQRWMMAATTVAVLLISTTAGAQTPTTAQRDAIRKSCSVDYQASCAGVPTGGRPALLCLQQHISDLSPACRSAVGAVTTGATSGAAPPAPASSATLARPQSAAGAGGLARACRGDAAALCGGVSPGRGRMLMCLRGHAASLSPPCQAALSSLQR
jgi:Cysteine rich repeat